jgi:hypothetical protein
MVVEIFAILALFFVGAMLLGLGVHLRMEATRNRILAVMREGNQDYYRVKDIQAAYRIRWGKELGRAMAYVALGNMDRQVEVEIVPGNGARYRLR